MGRHREISTASQRQFELQVAAGRPQFRARLPLAVIAFVAVCGFLLVNLADPYTTSPSWASNRDSQLTTSRSAQRFVANAAPESAVAAVNRDSYAVRDAPPVAPPPALPAAKAAPPAAKAASPVAKTAPPAAEVSNSGSPRDIGRAMAAARGWTGSEWECLDALWTQESHWNPLAENSIGAYGIPQAYPGNKLASAGSDWRTSAGTQITWGLNYLAGKYGSPCGAWHGYTDSY